MTREEYTELLKQNKKKIYSMNVLLEGKKLFELLNKDNSFILPENEIAWKNFQTIMKAMNLDITNYDRQIFATTPVSIKWGGSAEAYEITKIIAGNKEIVFSDLYLSYLEENPNGVWSSKKIIADGAFINNDSYITEGEKWSWKVKEDNETVWSGFVSELEYFGREGIISNEQMISIKAESKEIFATMEVKEFVDTSNKTNIYNSSNGKQYKFVYDDDVPQECLGWIDRESNRLLVVGNSDNGVSIVVSYINPQVTSFLWPKTGVFEALEAAVEGDFTEKHVTRFPGEFPSIEYITAGINQNDEKDYTLIIKSRIINPNNLPSPTHSTDAVRIVEEGDNVRVINLLEDSEILDLTFSFIKGK